MLVQNASYHLDVRCRCLDLMGDIADQLLYRLLVLSALLLFFFHFLVILQQLILHF